jgi:beta-mannosidase
MKQTISLDGAWQIVGVDGNGSALQDPTTLPPKDAVILEGRVPGEVHLDLIRAGIIPDPHLVQNAEDVEWVGSKIWWYRRDFEVPESFSLAAAYLEFSGLDTYATIYLNGVEIGTTNNMFIPHTFAVGNHLQIGKNTLAVRFDPISSFTEETNSANPVGSIQSSHIPGRKMQCQFGANRTRRPLGAGIWRHVRLVSYDAVSIADVHIEPEIECGRANAWVTIEVANHTREDQEVMASVVIQIGDDRETIEVVDIVTPFGGVIETVIRIEEPQLWWPNGFGDQPLYTCMVGLRVAGEVQDVTEKRFGVREVKLVERTDDGSPAFTLLINGRRVFCKGGYWIPADYFPSNVTRERYRELVLLAAQANINALRVWGGGIYESPDFYDACDEIGIMVWQDFMFPSGRYPEHQNSAAAFAREVNFVIKQLRTHPSIVVWCENDTCEINANPDQSFSGKPIFHEVIPKALASLDHTRPYRSSWAGVGSLTNSPEADEGHGGSWFKVCSSDVHRWRHIIEQDRALFISKFGAMGPPVFETLREFMPEDKLMPPDGPFWESYNRDNPRAIRDSGPSCQQMAVDLVRKMMGDFSTAEQFAALGGILQGEFLKAQIEHYRREKWTISGAFFWMFNDRWPSVGWSLVDYYLSPKIAYYYVKRACAPVIVSFKQLEDSVEVFVTSDERLSEIDATLHVGVTTFDACEFAAEELKVNLPANRSASFWASEPIDKLFSDPSRQCLTALLVVRGQVIARSIYFPLLFSEMDFPAPKLLVQRDQSDEEAFKMNIATDRFARNVCIANLPSGARLSDNYFDLLPGELHEVTVRGITADDFSKLSVNVWRK